MAAHPDGAGAPRITPGSHDGLAYLRVEGAAPPRGGIVVLHGAGSRKENHLAFAELCATAAITAIVLDQRGHGASEGALGAGALDDVAAIAELLPPGPRFLGGSSMGGFVALAAAPLVGARAVVAICPASGAQLLAGLRARSFDFRADRAGLERVLLAADLDAAASALGPDLLLLHAEGDDRVPIAGSERLHELAAGSTLVRVPGGDHGSVQHDPALQRLELEFLLARAAPADPRTDGG
jgi:pimeloyl-ACP methyl ester carboxylesterase